MSTPTENDDSSPSARDFSQSRRSSPSGVPRESGTAGVPGSSSLPSPLVERWMQPFTRFFRIEAASGAVLVVCTFIALMAANSQWADLYHDFWHTEIAFAIGAFELSHSLGHWITDGLMTIFFFVVGLEIKREIVAGELREPRKAALPAIAAVGGMIFPAGIFLAVQWGQPGAAGWGVPIATDIAFVVALIAVLGTRVPPGLKIMILSLAIADDIGAVIVIAFFYTEEISLFALGMGMIGFVITFALNRIGVRRVPVYVFVGVCIWFAFLQSGVHPVVAGVMLGLLTPSSAWIGDRAFLEVATEAIQRLRTGEIISRRQRQESLGQLSTTAYESISPLERLQHGLHPWVAFVIIPLFALANVGVTLDPSVLRLDWDDPNSSLMIAVAAGLALGKPIGIVLFSYLAVRVGLARLPLGVNWRIMVGCGCIAGIGFTMSLLIASLSLSGSMLEAAKIGTLAGSCVSAVFGFLILWLSLRRESPRRATGREL
jgi:Na+:H+ antiporter, NhaA family